MSKKSKRFDVLGLQQVGTFSCAMRSGGPGGMRRRLMMGILVRGMERAIFGLHIFYRPNLNLVRIQSTSTFSC